MVVHTANIWGWQDLSLTKARRKYIAEAACRQVAYDLGYAVSLAVTGLPNWYDRINNSITTGENAVPLMPRYVKREKYLTRIEKAHPRYIREMYRYAESVLGPLATYQEIVKCMNDKSKAPGEA